jgi:hypothetical protein
MDFLAVTRFCESWRIGLHMLSACALALLVAACGATVEDAVPGARRTGVYPNLNIPQRAATEQLTNAETEEGIDALSAARREQKAAGATGSRSDAERLRRLRQRHAEDALRQIEN